MAEMNEDHTFAAGCYREAQLCLLKQHRPIYLLNTICLTIQVSRNNINNVTSKMQGLNRYQQGTTVEVALN